MLQNRREGSVRSGLPTLKLFTTESREDLKKSYATLAKVEMERSGLRTKNIFEKPANVLCAGLLRCGDVRKYYSRRRSEGLSYGMPR